MSYLKLSNLERPPKNGVSFICFYLLTSSPYLHFPYIIKFLHISVRNLWTYGVDGVKLSFKDNELRPLSAALVSGSALLSDCGTKLVAPTFHVDFGINGFDC